MSITLREPLRGRALFDRIWRFTLRRMLFPFCVLVPFAYLFPKIALFYAVCGAYDVSRNTGLKLSTLRRYFIGNGFLVWTLSPINILLDLLSLPYINKGVYRLEDLPPDYQNEVKRLIRVTDGADLVRQVEERSKEHRRMMIFWRSYGINSKTFVNVSGFYEPWRYIKTIGLSVFNKKITTSPHFGWLRPTLRVLYNINDITDKSAYIVVGDRTNYWRDNKLFIFDDTLLHLSANETDQLRYCMFVDILRPSPLTHKLPQHGSSSRRSGGSRDFRIVSSIPLALSHHAATQTLTASVLSY
ncbi:MAG TPA: aspartyl/asparaginyl beta-hydroxylase domain-containing protein [Xanthobacteraceae bacterium]|nr:aspartyl/asparaginyl beta-hydroxylase domain-containing protein [Xanthobacteraceae bacterium]